MKDYELAWGHAVLYTLGAAVALLVASLVFSDVPKDIIGLSTLLVASATLGFSLYCWKKSFRPMLSIMVVSHKFLEDRTALNLEIINSGSLPAKDIRLIANKDSLEEAYGSGVNDEDKNRWVCCFDEDNIINALQQNHKIHCSFGTFKENDTGFWKYKSKIGVTLKYKDFFGRSYEDEQQLVLINSDSFTGYSWG